MSYDFEINGARLGTMAARATKPVILHDLHDQGNKWFQQSLLNGGPLAEQFARVIDLPGGRTYLLGFRLPDGSPGDLSEGLTNDRQRPTLAGSVDSLLGLIRILETRTMPPIILAIEDDVRDSQAPAIKRLRPADYFVWRGTVYHIATPESWATADELRRYIARSGSGYPLNAWILGGLSCSDLEQDLDAGQLQRVAEATLGLVTMVLDWEGLAVWLRPGLLQLVTPPAFDGDSVR